MSEQAKYFKPHEWGNLGPTRLTACAKAYCDIPAKEVLENNFCNPKNNITGAGFKVRINSFLTLNIPRTHNIEWLYFYCKYAMHDILGHGNNI